MFSDVSFSQLGIVAAATLLVTRPQDFPRLARSLGRVCGRCAASFREVRSVAARLSASLEAEAASNSDASRVHREMQAGLDELRKLRSELSGEFGAPLTSRASSRFSSPSSSSSGLASHSLRVTPAAEAEQRPPLSPLLPRDWRGEDERDEARGTEHEHDGEAGQRAASSLHRRHNVAVAATSGRFTGRAWRSVLESHASGADIVARAFEERAFARARDRYIGGSAAGAGGGGGGDNGAL